MFHNYKLLFNFDYYFYYFYYFYYDYYSYYYHYYYYYFFIIFIIIVVVVIIIIIVETVKEGKIICPSSARHIVRFRALAFRCPRGLWTSWELWRAECLKSSEALGSLGVEAVSLTGAYWGGSLGVKAVSVTVPLWDPH